MRVKKKIVADEEEDSNGGWSANVASCSDGLMIAVSLDKFVLEKSRAYWVGFWHERSEPIRRLYEYLPRELRPQLSLQAEDAEPRSGVWVLKQPLAPKLFDRPVAEHYVEDEKYFGFYSLPDNLNLDRAVNFISRVLLAQEVEADEEAVDVRLIDRDPHLTTTEKERLIRARCGQGSFRKSLETIWKSGCPLTEHSLPELLRASHIMPWRDANNHQRLDPNNGILLSANIDALFDKHLISFTDEGSLMISDLLPAKEVDRLGLSQGKSIPLRNENKVYLAHHRERFHQKIASSRRRD